MCQCCHKDPSLTRDASPHSTYRKGHANYLLNPTIYFRYVNDIFIATTINYFDEITKLKDKFEKNNILKFTYELEICKQLPLLDTLITRTDHNITISIFTKPTTTDECLNYDRLCSHHYKVTRSDRKLSLQRTFHLLFLGTIT